MGESGGRGKIGVCKAGFSTDKKQRLCVAMAISFAAFGVAAALVGSEARGGLPDSLIAATFMTFSILTVPHMLVPHLSTRRVPWAAPAAA